MPEQKKSQYQKRDPYSDVEPGRPVFPSTEQEGEDIESGGDVRRSSQREDDAQVGDEDTGPDKDFRK